jgi:hypothetical protein
MTESELKRRVHAAVKALALEFAMPLQEEISGRPTTTVDRLLCVWRRLSEEERMEFFQRALRPQPEEDP